MSENSEIITNLPVEEDNTSEIEIDLNDIERRLDEELNVHLSDLELLEEDKEKIGNPKAVGETVLSVVWDQFINQVGVIAGEDFVKENRGLTLDLRDKVHILSAEEFEKGNLPSHNFENKGKYEQRYNETRADYQTDPNADVKASKNMRYNEDTKTYERYVPKENNWIEKTRYNEETKTWEDYEPRTGKWEKKLAPGAREKFDTRTKKEKGSKTVNKDHVISAAEQIRDTEAAAYMDRNERQDFAKSDINIQDLDSGANQSKSDLSTEDWLNIPREDGQSQAEYFDLDEEQMRHRDAEAREAYQEKKEEAKQKAIEEGRKSQKDEALRIGGKALRAVLMGLLAELIRNVVNKLISWLRSGNKSFRTFIDQVKDALLTFVRNIKRNILTAGNTLVTTIATAIVGPVVGTIKKAWILIKQGAKSVKEAIEYINNPENKGKSLGILMLEVGKIVMAGLTAAGAMVLGEVIEKGLLSIPGFAFEIPLLGSLATILGMFLGALVSGIIGALVLNLIDRIIANKQKEQNATQQIDKRNDILATQSQLVDIKIEQFCETKMTASQSIAQRHQAAAQSLKEALETIYPDNGTKATGETI